MISRVLILPGFSLLTLVQRESWSLPFSSSSSVSSPSRFRDARKLTALSVKFRTSFHCWQGIHMLAMAQGDIIVHFEVSLILIVRLVLSSHLYALFFGNRPPLGLYHERGSVQECRLPPFSDTSGSKEGCLTRKDATREFGHTTKHKTAFLRSAVMDTTCINKSILPPSPTWDAYLHHIIDV